MVSEGLSAHNEGSMEELTVWEHVVKGVSCGIGARG